MSDGFDIKRELAAGLSGRVGAWRFIRGFVSTWHEPLSAADGWSSAELDAAGERLGVPLPTALREAYQLFGRRDDLTSNHDSLLNPDELYLNDGALVFREENQACAFWGILSADLERPDPAVYVRADLADESAENWEGWLDTFSTSCLEIVLAESMHAPEELCDFMDGSDEPLSPVLEEHFTLLPFPAYPTSQPDSTTRWFASPEAILRQDGDCLHVRARTEDALEELRELIDGDWLG
ncbi:MULTISPECIES: SMI1/KNR4 family protein [Actinomadura]|uniref:SMI1/KNR4 family protein n=1 Tax=Actinomadura yumaensis TaxID=111807 RepID=A0ABW2CET4_9ACTN|nr:SMI1/KNR4 family protein [Actinomadura sp. J1-007]MWK38479.1 SMI1/KNR4 family protein [Actinomadura sp. J1-007]